jgi:hypothetical protein
VASALAASVAGVLHVSDFSVAEPQTLGLGDELAAIAAAVVGGCSLQGGIGTVPGVVLGVFFLRAIVDGIAKVIKTGSEVYEGLIVGMVVVVAVAVSQLRLAGGRGKQFFPGALGWASIVTLALFSGLLGAVVVGDSLLARMREAFGDAPGPVGRFLISTLGEHAGWSAMCLATVLLIAVKLSQQRSSFTPSSSAP